MKLNLKKLYILLMKAFQFCLQNNRNYIWNDGWHAFYSNLELGAIIGGCGVIGDPWLAEDCENLHGYMCRYTEGFSLFDKQHFNKTISFRTILSR